MLAVHSHPLGAVGTTDNGGMSIYIRELALELGKRGHLVDIYTRRLSHSRGSILEYAENVRLIEVEVPGTENLQRAALYPHHQRFCSAIGAVARSGGVAYDLLHSNYWISGVVGSILRSQWQCPHIITFHTLGAAKNAVLKGDGDDGLRLEQESLLVTKCEGIIVPSEIEKHHLELRCKEAGGKVHSIPFGVNLSRFTVDPIAVSQPKSGDEKDRCSVLFVGRVDPIKNVDLVLESMQHLAEEVELVIIGGDGQGEEPDRILEQKVVGLGLAGRVHLLGRREHASMAEYYKEADVVAVTSRYESCGFVILEALASGTVVVSTPIGIAPEVIEPGVNGYLADHDNGPGFAEAVSRGLRLSKKIDKRSVRQSVEKYAWERVAASHAEVYSGVVKQ